MWRLSIQDALPPSCLSHILFICMSCKTHFMTVALFSSLSQLSLFLPVFTLLFFIQGDRFCYSFSEDNTSVITIFLSHHILLPRRITSQSEALSALLQICPTPSGGRSIQIFYSRRSSSTSGYYYSIQVKSY